MSVRVREYYIYPRTDQVNKNSKLNIELVKLSFQEKTGEKDNTHRGKYLHVNLVIIVLDTKDIYFLNNCQDSK